MSRQQNPNLEILERAVELLAELADEMVFVGGCATGMLITDPAAPAIRPTKDVDTIVQVASMADYWGLADRLREKGFSEDVSEGAPICRWVAADIILDVMPTDETVMGFGNPWYDAAARYAQPIQLPGSGAVVRLITAPYFLVTKLDAFAGRGRGDYMASHDIEDIIAVIDGRPTLLEEVTKSAPELRAELAKRFTELLGDSDFEYSIQGHLPPDASSLARFPLLMRVIRSIAEVNGA